MRAAWFESFGSAAEVLQIGELETPTAKSGEVLVRMHTSGVNPSDVKKRAGSFPNLLDAGPVVPNSDGAGVIEAVGDGVDASRVGERVWIYQAQFARRYGTAAQYVAIDSCRAVTLSDNTTFETGACLGIPVMTAHRAIFADGDVAGQTILITGGAGRVGFYAVQWASLAGATVIATASNADDTAVCKAAGAHHVVNHRDEKSRRRDHERDKWRVDRPSRRRRVWCKPTAIGKGLEGRRRYRNVLFNAGCRAYAAVFRNDVQRPDNSTDHCLCHARSGEAARD